MSARTTGTRVKRIVKEQPCLVCGRYGVDPAHWPVRQSHGAGWGLLEIIPLCRFHHDLLDNNVGDWPRMIGLLGSDFHRRMYLVYNGEVYMGTPERIAEVLDGL